MRILLLFLRETMLVINIIYIGLINHQRLCSKTWDRMAVRRFDIEVMRTVPIILCCLVCCKSYKQSQKAWDTLYILAHISPSQLQHLSGPAPPLSMLYRFRDVNQSNKEQHWKGEGVWRANKALISSQQAALTRKSDFPGECLNNFATACLIASTSIQRWWPINFSYQSLCR